MQLLSGKEVAAAKEAWLTAEIAKLSGGENPPCLAVVIVGENPESQTYVASKVKTAQRVGMRSFDRRLPADVSQSALEAEIEALNGDPAVHGILCQLPLPAHLDPARITQLIDPAKDVDCFHPFNFGLLAQGEALLKPCTPAGILEILDYYKIPVAGRNVVVLGRSNIVGRPLSLLLSQKGRDATVTVCHSRTPDLASHTQRADILAVGLGRAEFVGADLVPEGCVVVDVGVNRVPDPSKKRGYRLAGDVDFAAVSPKCAAITPVPGGVGPMTIVMLLTNTLAAYRQQTGMA